MVGISVARNVGLMFQFAGRLLPYSYEVTLRNAAYNQVAVVPGRAVEILKKSIGDRNQSNQQKGNANAEQAK
jgi:hypothetical protein